LFTHSIDIVTNKIDINGKSIIVRKRSTNMTDKLTHKEDQIN